MWIIAVRVGYVLLALTALCGLGCALWGAESLLTLAVLSATLAYHIFMRSWVGNGCYRVMHNHADYRKRWFCVSPGEERLYRRLRVNRWKNKLPTNDPTTFDPKRRSWDEIAQTTCQSEVVHELNLVLSAVPILAAVRLRLCWAVALISLAAGAADGVFVIIQRYNRARIVRLVDRQRRKAGGILPKDHVFSGERRA